MKAAKKEANAIEAAKEIALGRIEALSKKIISTRASTCESNVVIAISQDEYNSLNKTFVEANELSNMKFATFLAPIDALKVAE